MTNSQGTTNSRAEIRNRSRRLQAAHFSGVGGLAWLTALALVSLVFAGALQAQTVRVTTLGFGDNGNAKDSVQGLEDAAAKLQKLNPDVILLQDVADWQMCNRLAEALKPVAYNVVVCSAFAATGATKPAQVAILSRHKAYISWAQNWRSESGEATANGFVFAAIQIGQRRLGFFSLQPGPKGMANQWLRGIAGIKSWVNNRVEGFMAASPLNPQAMDRASLQLLEEAGFSNPFISQFSDTRDAGPVAASLIANVSVPQGIILDHWPATCDVGIEVPPAGTVITAVRGRLLPPEPPPSTAASPTVERLETAQRGNPLTGSVARPEAPPSIERSWQTFAWWLIPMAGLIVVGLMLRAVWVSRQASRIRRAPALLALKANDAHGLTPSKPALMAPASTTGSSAVLDSSASAGHALLTIARPPEAGSEEDWKRRALIAEQQAREAAELVRRGLVPQVSEWLKGKMFRKLIGDRNRIAEMQEEATRKTLHVDERLARVEQQVQQQHRAYQDRIDALTRELRAARSENCELIRAQITQVKAEMEASRARLMAEAGEDFPG